MAKKLFRDTLKVSQPQNTLRFAKNIILNVDDDTLTNERGNILVNSLPSGYKIIGK